MLDLGLSLPAGSQYISSTNVVMFHHHGWEPDGETWGEGGQMPTTQHTTLQPPGLSHNVHEHHIVAVIFKLTCHGG